MDKRISTSAGFESKELVIGIVTGGASLCFFGGEGPPAVRVRCS